MVQVRANKSCDTNVRGTVASVLKTSRKPTLIGPSSAHHPRRLLIVYILYIEYYINNIIYVYTLLYLYNYNHFVGNEVWVGTYKRIVMLYYIYYIIYLPLDTI